MIASPSTLPSAPDVLDVDGTLLLARCRCGGAAKRYKADIGHYVICGERCNSGRGSGVFHNPDDAGRAWNRLQEVAR